MNKKRLSARIKKKSIILVDVMAEEIHQNVHIKGAINIPFSRLEHDVYEKLDPRSAIVTYSLDYDCPVGRSAAQKLRDLGYRNVFYYPGGLQEWLESGLPVEKSGTPATG